MTSGQSTTAVWTKLASKPSFPRLEKDVTVDVAIVGAGITGLSTALLLHQAGFKVAVIDANEVGQGVSGFNSGHLTSMLLDLRYSTIQSHFGAKGAHMAAESQQAAISQVEDLVQRYDIDCHFSRLIGYLYTEDDDGASRLERESEAARRAGIQILRADFTPVPFEDRIKKSLVIPDQARINPYEYCIALARILHEGGQLIYEHSRVRDFSDHIPLTIKTDHGCIIADNLVLATHTPIGFLPLIQSKLAPYRSYIIGIRSDDEIQDALYWYMAEPYHYTRLVLEDARDGRPLIIIGGEDHPAGQKRNTQECFDRLELYARERFNVLSVEEHWSTQLYQPADGLPYIGRYGHEQNLYIATGYSGEGLTCGTMAGMIISDLIRGIPNPWSRLYDAGRLKPIASAREVLSQNRQVVENFIGDRLKREAPRSREEVYDELTPGQGKIGNIDGEKRALYCDEKGAVHELSPVCTHARCHVHWNEAEKTWDCPCHGGRYSATGEVINGPPTEALSEIYVHRPTDLGRREHQPGER